MAQLETKFESKSQEWETPNALFDPLNNEFNFTLDVCATNENKKVENFYSKTDNALIKDWGGICWMNPPFNALEKWVKKAYMESKKGAIVVCLIPCRTNTNWWHDYIMQGEIRFIKGRPRFNGMKHGLPQPLAIVVFKNGKGT